MLKIVRKLGKNMLLYAKHFQNKINFSFTDKFTIIIKSTKLGVVSKVCEGACEILFEGDDFSMISIKEPYRLYIVKDNVNQSVTIPGNRMQTHLD